MPSNPCSNTNYCAPWPWSRHNRDETILTYVYLWANVHVMLALCRRAVPATRAVLAFESMPFMRIQYDYCAPWSHHHRVAMILAYAPYLRANVHAMIALCRAVPATSAAICAFESMSFLLQPSTNTQFNMYTNKRQHQHHKRAKIQGSILKKKVHRREWTFSFQYADRCTTLSDALFSFTMYETRLTYINQYELHPTKKSWNCQYNNQHTTCTLAIQHHFFFEL